MNTNTDITSVGYKVNTMEDIRAKVPSVFAKNKGDNLSDRYSFVPTFELLEAFQHLGWNPQYARQNGYGLHARHMIRLNNSDLGFMPLKRDQVRPQIVLDNSHNGMSSAQIHMGLFRLICSNGLVVAMPGMFTSVRLRHVGIDMTELRKLLEVVANQYNVIGKHIGDMQDVKLNTDQREEFVIRALAAREPRNFLQEDGTINIKKATTIIKPKEILNPIRGEDKLEDLWSVFNVIQERFVKGMFERQTMNGRRTNPRGITNAKRHLDFNIKLWDIAESYIDREIDVEVTA